MLRQQPLATSTHFALYYKMAQSPDPLDRSIGTDGSALSTEFCPSQAQPVDNIRIWLGIVIPKRLSRRAVTRSLLKRQIRSAATRTLNRLKSGNWIIRQRTAFRSTAVGSAAPEGLKLEARRELDGLFEKAWRDGPSRPQ
jgi:ribonuclease P protein component